MASERKPRNWFVAIADTSGEFEGNPAAFEAAQVYGPFTEEEAGRLASVDAEAGGFDHATYDGVSFPAVRITEKRLAKKIRETVAQSRREQDEAKAELENTIRRHRADSAET